MPLDEGVVVVCRFATCYRSSLDEATLQKASDVSDVSSPSTDADGGRAWRPRRDGTPSGSPSLVSIGNQPQLAQVGKVTDATNALTSSPTSAPITDLDIEEQRAHPHPQLVGEAEAAPGFPRVHRQHNVELRVHPQREALKLES